MPLVAVKISACIESPIPSGRHSSGEHLAGDDEEHVGQAVERLRSHDQPARLGSDVDDVQHQPAAGPDDQRPFVAELRSASQSEQEKYVAMACTAWAMAIEAGHVLAGDAHVLHELAGAEEVELHHAGARPARRG